MHASTSYQWFISLLAWCHCRCESNQGCTSHTRISQSNLFSSFLLCASFTPLHIDCIDACAHSGILRICMHSAYVLYSSYLDLLVMSVVRFALNCRFGPVPWSDVTGALWEPSYTRLCDCNSENILFLIWFLFLNAVTVLYCQHLCIFWFFHSPFHSLNHR